MSATTAVKIYEIEQGSEAVAQINSWSVLWWSDFEEAGIDRCYVAFDGDFPIGFQTVDRDGLCTAIEVHSKYQGQGIAAALVEESNCWRPDRNENPEFWAAMEEKFGW